MAEQTKRERVRERMLRQMPKGGKVAEIGVWEGNFSRRILEICEPAELHLIDPWLYMPQFVNTGFGRKKNEHHMEEMFREVSRAFQDDPRVKIHRATSDVALETFPDASLDWVYIDGNHNEPFIGLDLALCLRKVKADGIIVGDDYHWQTESANAPVRQAVEAVVEQFGTSTRLKVMANQYILKLDR